MMARSSNELSETKHISPSLQSEGLKSCGMGQGGRYDSDPKGALGYLRRNLAQSVCRPKFLNFLVARWSPRAELILASTEVRETAPLNGASRKLD